MEENKAYAEKQDTKFITVESEKTEQDFINKDKDLFKTEETNKQDTIKKSNDPDEPGIYTDTKMLKISEKGMENADKLRDATSEQQSEFFNYMERLNLQYKDNIKKKETIKKGKRLEMGRAHNDKVEELKAKSLAKEVNIDKDKMEKIVEGLSSILADFYDRLLREAGSDSSELFRNVLNSYAAFDKKLMSDKVDFTNQYEYIPEFFKLREATMLYYRKNKGTKFSFKGRRRRKLTGEMLSAMDKFLIEAPLEIKNCYALSVCDNGESFCDEENKELLRKMVCNERGLDYDNERQRSWAAPESMLIEANQILIHSTGSYYGDTVSKDKDENRKCGLPGEMPRLQSVVFKPVRRNFDGSVVKEDEKIDQRNRHYAETIGKSKEGYFAFLDEYVRDALKARVSPEDFFAENFGKNILRLMTDSLLLVNNQNFFQGEWGEEYRQKLLKDLEEKNELYGKDTRDVIDGIAYSSLMVMGQSGIFRAFNLENSGRFLKNKDDVGGDHKKRTRGIEEYRDILNIVKEKGLSVNAYSMQDYKNSFQGVGVSGDFIVMDDEEVVELNGRTVEDVLREKGLLDGLKKEQIKDKVSQYEIYDFVYDDNDEFVSAVFNSIYATKTDKGTERYLDLVKKYNIPVDLKVNT